MPPECRRRCNPSRIYTSTLAQTLDLSLSFIFVFTAYIILELHIELLAKLFLRVLQSRSGCPLKMSWSFQLQKINQSFEKIAGW